MLVILVRDSFSASSESIFCCSLRLVIYRRTNVTKQLPFSAELKQTLIWYSGETSRYGAAVSRLLY